jgi:hypothetical protein
MLGKLYLVVMAIFTLAHLGPVIGDGDALVHIFEVSNLPVIVTRGLYSKVLTFYKLCCCC